MVAVFAEALDPGRVFFDRDIQGYWVPQVATFVRIVGEGGWPLWDPYEGYGLPLLADPTSQVAYPLTWLNLVLLPATVYKVLVLGHVLLAGVGASLLLRALGASPLAAAASGMAWCASGPLLSAGSLPQHVCGAAWMPWVLLGLERVLEEPGARRAGVLGVLAGLQVLAGSAEMVLFSALLGGARLAFAVWPGAAPAAPRARLLRALLGAAGLALSLSAVLWLPLSALLGAISAGRFAPGGNLYWSLHPLSLVDLMAPRFSADLPLSLTVRQALFEGREPFLLSLYLGLATLPAAVLARGLHARWACVLVATFGVLALGRHVPLAALVLSVAPFRLFRYPVKYTIPLALSWSLLVGLGVDRWLADWDARDRRRALGAGLALGLLAILAVAAGIALHRDALPFLRLLDVPSGFAREGAHVLGRTLARTAAVGAASAALLVLRARERARPRTLARALVLLAAVDLVAAGRGVNPLAPRALLDRRPPTLDLLGPDRDGARLLSAAVNPSWLNQHFVRTVEGWDARASWALGLQDRLTAPMPARWHVRGSYDADFIGLATPALPFLSGATLVHKNSTVGRNLLRMGNVGWVVTPETGGFEGLAEVGRVSSVFDVPLRVLKVPDPLPPAWVVGGVRRAASPDDAVRVFAEDSFDPAREVVLPGSGEARAAPVGFQGRAALVERRADRLVVEVEASAPAQLVVAEAYQRGWTARVDGTPAEVTAANVLFRAVAVPTGQHRVELAYRPAAARTGAWLSVAGLVAALGLFARTRTSA